MHLLNGELTQLLTPVRITVLMLLVEKRLILCIKHGAVSGQTKNYMVSCKIQTISEARNKFSVCTLEFRIDNGSE